MNIEDFIDSVEGFELLTQKDQVKYISFFHTIISNQLSFSSGEIKGVFQDNHLKLPANITNELNRLAAEKPPILVKGSKVYSFHRAARKELEEQFIGSKHRVEISKTLRDLVPKIKSEEQRKFLDEAIKCFEVKAFRASVLLTWLLTMDFIYEYILKNELSAFQAATSSNGKYKKITISSKDDFSEFKEADLIMLLRTSKIISNDTRKILDEKLGIRNTCAHPNSVIIKESKALNFIDDIVENIVLKFQE